jgi:SAM-dependent methyltransferase
MAEFDRFADEYHNMQRRNIAITGEEPAYFSAYKIRLLAAALRERGLQSGRILDFGSGIGNSVPFFRAYLADAALTCVDVSRRSLDLAQARFPGREDYRLIEGERLPVEDGAFGAVFSACVFHHIPAAEHVHWLRALRLAAAPGGMLAVFEHNPLNPLSVRAVNTCPFDENARLIQARVLAARCREAGWGEPRIRYHVFFPRALAGLRGLEPRLGWLPLGAQYSVMAVRP